MVNALIDEMNVMEEVTRHLQRGSVNSSRTDLERARRELLELHPPDSCPRGGRGHGFWTVKRVLREMSDAPAGAKLEIAAWMHPLWGYTSRIDHHSGFERMFRFDGERRWMGPAEPWQRVQTFLWLIQVYGSIVGWVAEQYSRPVAEELVSELASLSGQEVLLEVAALQPQMFSVAIRSTQDSPADDGDTDRRPRA